MFDKWKLNIWRTKVRCILNNIQENNENILNKEYCSGIQYFVANNTILQLYNAIDKMETAKYVILYKRVYLYYILPEVIKLIKLCGTSSIEDIINIFGVKLDNEFQTLMRYFIIYKVEIIQDEPEIDEELIKEFKNRRCFFWNSYPSSTKTIEEQLNGAKLYVPFNKEKYFVIYGIFHENAYLYCKNHRFVAEKMKNVENTIFNKKYLETINLREYLVNDKNLFDINLMNAKKDLDKLKSRSLNDIQKEFEKINIIKQRKIINVLLSSEYNEDHLKAKVLYDISKTPLLSLFCKQQLKYAQKIVNEKISFFDTTQDINYKEKIILLKVDDNVKQRAFEKLRDVNSGREISSKAQQYIDGLLKIPFGVYTEEPIFKELDKIREKTKMESYTHNEMRRIMNDSEGCRILDEYDLKRKKYMCEVKKTLNNCVHGHVQAKIHIERLIGQWINGKMTGSVFGFQGPPGTGKTTLAKNGFAKCLLDCEGESRPIAFLPIGGSSGGSFLEGHGYTYMGSTWGKIVDMLMEKKCMNPVIYIDELDKISQSDKGQEINGILIHLTDASQNKEFSDKYFSGIKFDLSKAIIIFSYNDPSKIDSILRDRITEIQMSPLSTEDKLIITNEYMVPEIVQDIGFTKTDIKYSNEVVNYIIDTYTNEAGVRKLKELLYTVYRDINIKYLQEEISLPFEIDVIYLKELFRENPKNQLTSIDKLPSIGKVNGLYASTQGMGGITLIEVSETPTDENLSLILTGSQGDIMKESMKCSKTLAWNLLTNEQKEGITKTGLHIHCPMGATPKDGPSAGCAITLAIYSRLTMKRIRNDVAMTGEINLNGSIHAIGGLEAKLFGALRAGVRTVLIPEENKDEYENFRMKYKNINLNVILVSTIKEIINNACINVK